MRTPGAQGTDAERGQASVELLAVLPAALLLAALGWQLLLTGQAAWLAGNAARVAARAQAVDGDPEAAARSALPSYLERGLEVGAERPNANAVRVRLRVPLLVRRWRSPIVFTATAAMERQAEGG